MAILKIARMGHPVLLQRAEPVADPGAPEIRRLVADMIETMEDAPAPASPRRRCMCRCGCSSSASRRSASDRRTRTTAELGNTVRDQPEARTARARSGCCAGRAACPSPACAPPCRALRASATGASTATASRSSGEVIGFHAGVVQHEYDHLDGILYPMRMTDFSLFGFNEELDPRAARPAGRPP